MESKFVRILIAVLVMSAGLPAFGTPYDLSYGGRLVEANGRPIAGPVSLFVQFYRSENGNDLVGAVTMPSYSNVSLTDGVFQVTISLTPSEFHILFSESQEAWIQITDATNGKSYPRQRFSAVPYALKVPVDGESITYNSDGELTLSATGGAAGKFLKFASPGVLVWDSIPGGGDMLISNNLSDLANASAARTNLGLGSLATKSAVGSSDITDASVTGSDIASGTIADANISATAAISSSKISGLGSLASKSAIGSSDITDGAVTGSDIADGTITDSDINATANISYLKISGLGSAASKDVGVGASEVAAGNHTHTLSAVTDAGSLAAKNSVASSDITDDAIVNADINASAGIAGTKISPDFGAQNVATTGSVSGGELKATGYVQTGTSAGAPGVADCDAAIEYGRLKTDTTNNRLYVCSTSGWLMIGGGEVLPNIRFTRATVAYNATDAAKDAACSNEYGTNYVAATFNDVPVFDLYTGSLAPADIARFNIAGENTKSYQTVNSGKNALTGGTYRMACIYKFAPIRYTRGSITAGASDATKDALCLSELGATYVGASFADVPYVAADSAISPEVSKFNVVGVSGNSYLHSMTSGGKHTVTGSVYVMACIRMP